MNEGNRVFACYWMRLQRRSIVGHRSEKYIVDGGLANDRRTIEGINVY